MFKSRPIDYDKNLPSPSHSIQSQRQSLQSSRQSIKSNKPKEQIKNNYTWKDMAAAQH